MNNEKISSSCLFHVTFVVVLDSCIFLCVCGGGMKILRASFIIDKGYTRLLLVAVVVLKELNPTYCV